MASLHHHFEALITNINPSQERRATAVRIPRKLRDWLRDHEFSTRSPHTRLSGSYRRQTAVGDIKDVDILLFVPETELDRTPNAVLQEVKRVLDDYPCATASTSPQRRSVHLDLESDDLQIDIVPAILENGLRRPLCIPDRPTAEWIASDPLGYQRRLSKSNRTYGRKLVPLIKLVKAWRNAQMTYQRPKSYALEIMTLYAVEGDHVELADRGWDRILADLFEYFDTEYGVFLDSTSDVPEIPDPQLPDNCVTAGWERSEFEAFMRRVKDAAQAAREAVNAIDKDDEEGAVAKWRKLFGDYWPDDETLRAAVIAEAKAVSPGVTGITSRGGVVGFTTPAVVTSRPTKYYGDE